MENDLMSTPAYGLLPHAVRERSLAPITGAQGTAVPSAGRCAAAATAPVAVFV